MNTYRTLVKKTITYGIFSALSSAVPFSLLPVLTRYLNVRDYGVLALFRIIVDLSTPIIRFEGQAYLRVQYAKKEPGFGDCVSTTIWMSFGTFVIVLFGLTLFKGFLPKDAQAVDMRWIVIALLMAFGTSIYTYVISYYQIQNKPLMVGVLTLSSAILIFVPTFVLVVGFHFNWTGRVWPEFATVILFQCPLAIYLFVRSTGMRLRFRWSIARASMLFSLPLVFVTISAIVLMSIDRLFIAQMVGVEAVGHYAAAAQLSAATMIPYSAFLAPWEVMVFDYLGQKSRSAIRRLVMAYGAFGVGMIAISLLVAVVAKLAIPWFLGPKFLEAGQYVVWLALSVGLRGLMYGFAPVMLYKGWTKVMMVTAVTIALLNLPLNYILIGAHGAVGAAEATAACYVAGIGIYGLYLFRHKGAFHLADGDAQGGPR